MAHFLVTGGAGFIGSHLVDALVERGDAVTVFDNLSSGSRRNIEHLLTCERFSFVQGDVCDSNDVSRLFSKSYDSVFHLAAQPSVSVSVREPEFDRSVNVEGSSNVFHNCVFDQSGTVRERIPHLIFASSAAVYGSQDNLPIKEDTLCRPQSPYAVNKLTSEATLLVLRGRGLSSSVLRFSNVYGPRQTISGEAGVIALFSDSFAKGKPLIIEGSGEQTRDFVYVTDVVRALMHASDLKLNGTYNVSSGERTSVNMVVETLRTMNDSSPSISHREARPGDICHSSLDNGALRATGWMPYVPLAEGLNRTLSYYSDCNLRGVTIRKV